MRNSIAHPPGPFSAAEEAQNGGEPARGGGDMHGYGDNSKMLRSCSIKRVPELLGATEDVPEHRGGSEVEGGALAAVEHAGAEEDEVETTA